MAEVIRIPQIARFRRSSAAQHAGRAIAASVLVTAGLWLGSQGASLSRLVINRDASAVVSNAPRTATGRKVRFGPGASSNPASWARNVIAQRAAVQVTDTFHRGMAAWGATTGWAAGWSRNPDGYVKPGDLALFQPAISYRDYRLEFFGEIEKLGIGWAVRAQDRKNYYAMKFKVIAPGLRPVLSMVYYPVVAGKPGHRVEVPLSVMVHDKQPYHVAVQVSRNRVTASIEGQEVDSWTDDLLPSGTVGFFADAGESARLYWMRVSKNDDFLGRVCAFLSGSAESTQTGASTQTAGILPRSRQLPEPASPVPAAEEPTLLARSFGTVEKGSSRIRAALNGRNIRTWSS